MQHVGVDIIEIDRIRRAIDRRGDAFLNRIFTHSEIKLYRNKMPSLAARFAAKEAVFKALGSRSEGIGWKDIEVLPDDQGKPEVHLYNNALKVAKLKGSGRLAISLSHTKEYAIAFVAGESEK